MPIDQVQPGGPPVERLFLSVRGGYSDGLYPITQLLPTATPYKAFPDGFSGQLEIAVPVRTGRRLYLVVPIDITGGVQEVYVADLYFKDETVRLGLPVGLQLDIPIPRASKLFVYPRLTAGPVLHIDPQFGGASLALGGMAAAELGIKLMLPHNLVLGLEPVSFTLSMFPVQVTLADHHISQLVYAVEYRPHIALGILL